MIEYSQEDRTKDFNFFIKNYDQFFQKYGHVFLAIRNEKVLGTYSSVSQAITNLFDKYKPGQYIIQECTGDDTAYKTSIMRLMIKG